MITAPIVTSLEVSKLSAHQVAIRWDEVGENFYYLVQIIKSKEPEASWQDLGYTADNDWFISTLTPRTFYKMRVATAAAGFEPSAWVETEEFETFDESAYTFELMNELTLSTSFIKEKFQKNNQNYVNFSTDVVWAALMSEDFQFSPAYEQISSIQNFILTENEYHEVQGKIEKVCIDKDRTMLMEADGILYLFEKYQPIVKVSADKGQTWFAIKLLNDRVGNPVSRTCFYQTSSTSYVLGYDRIFYGRKSSDVRWSSDEVRFSSQTVTFAKIGDQLNLGFDVEIYGTYSRLPAEISHIAEAICANDDYVYVVARDVVRRVKAKNAPVDTDPLSPTFGDKIFEPESFTITGNKRAVCSKMDSIDGEVFALITGVVKADNLDPTKPENITASPLIGVYQLIDNKFVRVFGNLPDERNRIEHGYTMMGVNDSEIYISSSNFRNVPNYLAQDPETTAKYELTDAVKTVAPYQYVHDKHQLMMSFRTNKVKGWKNWAPGRMVYYAEPFFSTCHKSGTRCWIDNNDQVVMVYSDKVHTKAIDPAAPSSTMRFMKEVWNKGDLTVISPNIEFTGFTRYAAGIMLYRYSGELIGYYEFNYRVLDQAKIVWKPIEVMLTAHLQNQTREVPFVPDNTGVIRNPDLTPLTTTMIPDSYLLQDSNFEAFTNYYLQFISNGYGTHYNNLLNLVRNKYPREKNSWEYLWSEIYKRNLYLDKEKRDHVARFFETRKNDFYSTKGIEESYKFLFKVLYNEEVEIEIESNAGLEYDIIVESDNIQEDLAGQTIYTPTGRCNVTYVERNYTLGKLQWRLTIHNMIGRYMTGQEVKAERSSFVGTIVQGIRGKELASNNIEYINRGRSYYMMKIKSQLPTSRYRDDVLRFVHPVGFGFIGITLISMFINAGLSMKHTETIINRLKNYRYDSGAPSVWPDRVAVIDSNGQIDKDPTTGEARYNPHPRAGEAYDLSVFWPTYNADNGNTVISGKLPADRRVPMSPLFDQSATTYSQYRNLINLRLKDNIGNPRDPITPNQVKIDE